MASKRGARRQRRRRAGKARPTTVPPRPIESKEDWERALRERRGVMILPGDEDSAELGRRRQREWSESLEAWRREFPAAKERLQAALAPHDAFDLLAVLQIASTVEWPRGQNPPLQHIEGTRELLALLLVERGARSPTAPAPAPDGAFVAAIQNFAVFAEELIAATPETLAAPPYPLDDGAESTLAQIRSKLAATYLLSPVAENDDQVDRGTAELFEEPVVRAHLLDELGLDAAAVLALTDAVASLATDGLLGARDRARAEGRWSGHGEALSFTLGELASRSGLAPDQVERFAERFALGFDGEPLQLGEMTTRARHRPFLRDGDRLMPIAVSTLRRSLRGSLAALLNPRLPAAGRGDKAAFVAFTGGRGRWLERRAMAILERALRPAWSESNVYFELPDGRGGEIDGLARVDSTLLVVQAKSGVMRLDTEVTDPARFRETLVGLLGGEGFRQHRDARAALSATVPKLTRDAAGAKPLGRDLAGLEQIVPILVTLEDLAVVAAQPWLFVDAGLAEEEDLPWIVGVDPLELLLDYFELPAVFLHFLSRRLRANHTRQLLALDEVDWAVRYGEDELLWAELSPEHPYAQRQFMVPEEHYDFDRWQLARQGGDPAKRPRPNLSLATRKLLSKLDRSRPDGWLGFSLALLDLPRTRRPAVLRLWERQVESDRGRQAIPLDVGFGHGGQPRQGFSVLREERTPHPDGGAVLRQFCEDQLARYGAEEWWGIVAPFRPRDPVRWCCGVRQGEWRSPATPRP